MCVALQITTVIVLNVFFDSQTHVYDFFHTRCVYMYFKFIFISLNQCKLFISL
jgi:hypothetical protein